MEFTLEELEQEQSARASEINNLIFTIESLERLQYQYNCEGFCRNDVLSIEQLSGSPLDVNPNYFTDQPSQTNLNLAMEGLLDKINIGLVALFAGVAALIAAVFIWIAKLFRGDRGGSSSQELAIAAAKAQRAAHIAAEAAVSDPSVQNAMMRIQELYEKNLIQPVREKLSLLTVMVLDQSNTNISTGGSLAAVKDNHPHLRYLVDGVRYVDPNSPQGKGVIYEAFVDFTTNMSKLIENSKVSQETYDHSRPMTDELGGVAMLKQPLLPVLELFATRESYSKVLLQRTVGVRGKTEYEQLRTTARQLLKESINHQTLHASNATRGYESQGALVSFRTYSESEEFNRVLARHAEAVDLVYFDTTSAAGKIDEIAKTIEAIKTKLTKKRNDGGFPDKARFTEFSETLTSIRADASFMAAYAEYYTSFYNQQTSYFTTVQSGLKNIAREITGMLSSEGREEAKKLLKSYERTNDDMITRLDTLAKRK